MYISKARDFKKDGQANIAAVKFSQNPKEGGNLLGVLRIKIGAHVMLTLNVDVTDSLTNGAMGTVSNVMQKGDKISVILVRFDNPSVISTSLPPPTKLTTNDTIHLTTHPQSQSMVDH